MYDAITIVLTLVACGIISAAIVVLFTCLPVKEEPQEIPIEQVIKEADKALAFDPLRDVKEKPQAVKPLLHVLLAIRERKAADDLEFEQREAVRREAREARDRQRELALKKQAEEQRSVAENDVLSGRIGRGHPNYPFTEAGRREAQQNQEDAGYKPLSGLNALSSLSMDAYQQYQRSRLGM